MYKFIELFPGFPLLVKECDDGTELWIPADEGNIDYQEYLASLEENK